MIEVVSIKFKNRGKCYFFSPGELTVKAGDKVIVETAKGLEIADCCRGNHPVMESAVVQPLRQVVRLATRDDLRIEQLNLQREKEAFVICQKKIAEHGLDMKLVDVECNFEGTKTMFFFTSDGRVDFRELVKDLAGIFRNRIELRQIGVRDEAKMLGGIGICGLPFCCHQFMDDFEPVSTKMAKTQSLSLNPTKISGSCGRLMCCLRYEQEAYEELVKGVPKNGAFVETPVGSGNVAQVNLLRQTVKVKLDDDDSFRSFDADEVAAVPGGRPKPGETPPHVLKVVPKQKKEIEEKEDEWVMPPIFAEDTAGSPEKQETEDRRSEGRSGSRRRRSRGKGASGTSSEKPAQPKAEKAEKAEKPAEAAEKSGGGKSGSSRRRRRKPSGEQAQKKQDNPQTPAKAPQPKQEKPAEGGEKKSSSSSRRRRRKPKPKAPGEGKAES